MGKVVVRLKASNWADIEYAGDRSNERSASFQRSSYHFARLFKESTGLAPHQYVIRRRVERAKELLLAGNSPIAEIALRAGFCDQSHLTLHFKRIYGLSPKAFVQRLVPRKTIH